MKKIFLIGCIWIIMTMTNAVFGQHDMVWNRTLGGTELQSLLSVNQTKDGGFIMAGSTSSGNLKNYHGKYDMWIVKMNSSKKVEWQKILGGSEDERATAVIQTSDGGYAVVGETKSSDGDVSNLKGIQDIWLLKLNAKGDIEWKKSIGGTLQEGANDIIESADGSLLIAGYTHSRNGDVSIGTLSGRKMWLVKVDITGEIIWNKTITSLDQGEAKSVLETSDFSIVIAGWGLKKTQETDKKFNQYQKACVLKLNALGEIEWEKVFEGKGLDFVSDMIRTADGGYALACYSNSLYDDSDPKNSKWNGSVVKLNASGEIEWRNYIGGSKDDMIFSIVQTSDEGFMVAGYSTINLVKSIGHHGKEDAWIVKINRSGIVEWQKLLGGSERDMATNIIRSGIDDYIVVGSTDSKNGDFEGQKGVASGFICKLSKEFQMSGNVVTSDYAPVRDVQINVFSDEKLISAFEIDDSGRYISPAFQNGKNYTVKADKKDNITNGMNVKDVLVLRKYLEGDKSIEDLYTYLAADIDNDNNVDKDDVLAMRQILTSMGNNNQDIENVWHFVPQSTVKDSNIFVEIPYAITLKNVRKDQDNQVFIGYKKGDLDHSSLLNDSDFFNPNLTNVELKIQNAQGFPGSVIEVPVICNNFTNGVGMQFSITWSTDKLQLISPVSYTGTKFPGKYYFNETLVSNGVLGVIWEADNLDKGNTIAVNAVCMKLKFRIIGKGDNLTEIKMSTLPFTSMFVDNNMENANLNVKTGIVKIISHTSVDANFTLESDVYPNPSSGVIRLNHDPDITSAEIVTIDGKVIQSLPLDVQSIDISRLNSGVYFVRLSKQDFSITRKIVLNKE